MKKLCQGGMLSEYNFVITYNKKNQLHILYIWNFIFQFLVVFSSDITK